MNKNYTHIDMLRTLTIQNDYFTFSSIYICLKDDDVADEADRDFPFYGNQ
jgi:hypothetical protein